MAWIQHAQPPRSVRAEYTLPPRLVVDWRRIAMDKTARVRECVRRAGLERLPSGNADDLRACGLDSLLSVLTVIELQKEFGIRIPANAVTDSSFACIDNLATLVPD
jgi:acyl carrier protein